MVLLPVNFIYAYGNNIKESELMASVSLDAYKHYYQDSSVSTKTQLSTFLFKNKGSNTVVIEQITVMLSGDYDDNYGPRDINIWKADVQGNKTSPIANTRSGILVKNSVATFSLSNVIVLNPGDSQIITFVGDITNMFPPQSSEDSYSIQGILVKCKGRDMSSGRSFIGPSNGAVIGDKLVVYNGSYI